MISQHSCPVLLTDCSETVCGMDLPSSLCAHFLGRNERFNLLCWRAAVAPFCNGRVELADRRFLERVDRGGLVVPLGREITVTVLLQV
jgi:hypothetical protein